MSQRLAHVTYKSLHDDHAAKTFLNKCNSFSRKKKKREKRTTHQSQGGGSRLRGPPGDVIGEEHGGSTRCGSTSPTTPYSSSCDHLRDECSSDDDDLYILYLLYLLTERNRKRKK